jgi:hypothetical protein
MAPAAVRTDGGGAAGLDNDNSTSLGNIAVKVRQRGEEKRCQSSCRLRHPETMKMDGGWGILEDDSLRDKVGMFLVL